MEWFAQPETLRARLNKIPVLEAEGLRPAQIKAIANLEASFKETRPRALIQMATGAGKTFRACTDVQRVAQRYFVSTAISVMGSAEALAQIR